MLPVQVRAPDDVGDTAAYFSPAVKVDTSGESAPSPSLSSATGNAYITGTTAYINTSRQVRQLPGLPTPTDIDSGILRVISHPSGFSSGGGDRNSSPFQTTSHWSRAVGASGRQTAAAYDDADLTNTATFAVPPHHLLQQRRPRRHSSAATSGGADSDDDNGSYTTRRSPTTPTPARDSPPRC